MKRWISGTFATLLAGLLGMTLFLSGCATTGIVRESTACDSIRGTWRYVDGLKTMEREYTAEGKCVCRNTATGAVQWTYDYTPVDASSVIVKKAGPHTLTADDHLKMEDAFTGHRTSAKDPTAKHAIVGTWEYESKGIHWRRVFTNDGKCVLTRLRDGAQMWACDYEVLSPTKVNLVRYWPNIVLNDGRLLMENSQFAERVK